MKRILVVSLAAMFLGLNGLVWADEAMMAATPNAMAPASTPGAMMMKKKMKKMKKKKAMKKETVLIGSAYSLFRDGKNSFRGVKQEESSLEYWGKKNVGEGICDMIALGRQSLADPLLPSKLEAGKGSEIKWCTGCDNCIEFLIRQRPVGCATHSKEYAKALLEIRKETGRLQDIEKHT